MHEPAPSCIIVCMRHEYTVRQGRTASRLINELGEVVFAGGLLECYELKGRYQAREELVRGRRAQLAEVVQELRRLTSPPPAE